MSEQKQSEAPAENAAAPVEMNSEELDGVVGGLAPSTVPAVHAAGPGHPPGPGQQQGIIAILIG